jgi:hypothetical protein
LRRRFQKIDQSEISKPCGGNVYDESALKKQYLCGNSYGTSLSHPNLAEMIMHKWCTFGDKLFRDIAAMAD